MSVDAYEQALDYLYGLINFEVKRHDRYMASKLDSSRPGRLLNALGAPHQQYPTIHIAGTKGKGSVAAMCAYCLRAAGLRVGLYTSPHVIDFRERIRIQTPDDEDGLISKSEVVSLVESIKTIIDSVPDTTWFEVVTAIAFLYFAQQNVDVGVIEVGLGGRLDATNVVTPLVSVITSLSYDHTEFLGDTLAQIATEKGGIIKPGVPVVAASQPPEALNQLLEIASMRASPISVVGRDWLYEGEQIDRSGGKQDLRIIHSPNTSFISSGSSFRIALAGAHQRENATVALAALSLVQPQFPDLTLAAITQGLKTVKWIGRLQTVHQSTDSPTVLVDCAHNPDSAAKLGYALKHDYAYDKLWLILGATSGKNVTGIMQQLLPLAEGTIATCSTHPRADDPAELVRAATELGFEMWMRQDVVEAMLAAWALAGPCDLICVTGSIFVVGDLLNEWERLKSRLLGNAVITKANDVCQGQRSIS